jgi:hypothetical protein
MEDKGNPAGTMETTLTTGSPAAADPAWDEAFMRVQSYLRAHGLESPVLLNQATAGIIREAREDPGAPGAEPVERAMEAAHARIGAWFARSGHDLDWTNDRMRAQGRMALVMADLPRRWPNHFLSPDPIPPELASAMASFPILPGPGVRLSGMAPEPLEFGVLEGNESGVPGRRIRFPARVMVTWFLIFGVLGAAWATTH